MKPFASLVAMVLALATVALSWRQAPPAEDAAMLMRYIQHLADGQGWVWNPGSRPEDGATDALFVLVAAAFTRLTGIEVELGVRLLNLLAHVGVIVLIFRHWVAKFSFHPVLAGILLTPLIAGPGSCFVPAGFATTFFVILLTIFYLLSYQKNINSKIFIAFLVVLARPEGIFLVAPELLWKWSISTNKKKVASKILLFAILPGILWLIWRQFYFGHIFPTPFYRKGGIFNIYTGFQSFYLGIMHVFPLIPVLVAGWWQTSVQTRWRTVLPVVLFLGMFSIMSNEMNFAARFQYAIVPALLLSPLMLPARQWAEKLYQFGGNHLSVIAGMLLASAFSLFAWQRYAEDRALLQPDVRDCIGQALAPFKAQHYRLATTEAGLLPFRSGWHSLDAWGLNDYAIARAGVVSQARLRQFAPTVIMLDEHLISERKAEWQAMNDTLRTFAAQNGYLLAGRYTLPGDSLSHWYWVDSRCPDVIKIKDIISNCIDNTLHKNE